VIFRSFLAEAEDLTDKDFLRERAFFGLAFNTFLTIFLSLLFEAAYYLATTFLTAFLSGETTFFLETLRTFLGDLDITFFFDRDLVALLELDLGFLSLELLTIFLSFEADILITSSFFLSTDLFLPLVSCSFYLREVLVLESYFFSYGAGWSFGLTEVGVAAALVLDSTLVRDKSWANFYLLVDAAAAL
jgi:hypothetical protein